MKLFSQRVDTATQSESVSLPIKDFQLAAEIVADLEVCNKIYLQKLEKKRKTIEFLKDRITNTPSECALQHEQQVLLWEQLKSLREEKSCLEMQINEYVAALSKLGSVHRTKRAFGYVNELKRSFRIAEEKSQQCIEERCTLEYQIQQMQLNDTKLQADVDQCKKETNLHITKCATLEKKIKSLEKELAVSGSGCKKQSKDVVSELQSKILEKEIRNCENPDLILEQNQTMSIYQEPPNVTERIPIALQCDFVLYKFLYHQRY